MANDLVGFSRAGDVFHWVWAARRCLGLISPNSNLKSIFVEGSPEVKKEGEYVIDVSECYKNETGRSIAYFQLKHTTTRENKEFILSDFKDTIEGFAKRYKQHYDDKLQPHDADSISFTIVTNRKIASSLRENFLKVSNGKNVSKQFKTTLEKYTGLKDTSLAEFCRIFDFDDAQGNYLKQREELRVEIGLQVVGTIDNELLDTFVALIQEKILPHSSNEIIKEDILKRFGITSEKQLYPAPPVWEKLESVLSRSQYNLLKDEITRKSAPFIVHAAGGVGKSVFSRHFVNTVEAGSVAVAFDCFGAGTYRSRSMPRHTHRDALIQIANELAAKGLCRPLIARDTSSEASIMSMFLNCLKHSLETLKLSSPAGKLYILIDAADNAEMAAEEFNQSCFAHELLAETQPDDCRLVMLCRTERIQLLKPRSNVVRLELEPFSEAESFSNLRTHFPNSIDKDGQEFHRLTAGNPRVQANALDPKYASVQELLSSLGPYGTTVDEQISMQLQRAVARIIDLTPNNFSNYVGAICYGLANLPPHIPISVLAEAASVDVASVKSFVADIGRSMWLYDSSVQFRDEPTETWFRKNYCAGKTDFELYLKRLEPLAETSTYVAEVLPQLYLQAEQYSTLIEVALSDKYLPQNPIDTRNVRVYRLQFAFKAALKAKQYKDAAVLSMRAGEEVAGDSRQLQLFQQNTDLLVALQSPEKVQEIAFRRRLHSTWDGSENIYSASLLSCLPEYLGDSRVFLRSAFSWLDVYIDEYEKKKRKDKYTEFRVDEQDFLEFAFSTLNIDGVDESLIFVNRLNNSGMFSVMRLLTKRLIEHDKFDIINEYLEKSTDKPFLFIAIVSELARINKVQSAGLLKTCLDTLYNKATRIKPSTAFRFDDPVTPAIFDFLESCIYFDLPQAKIVELTKFYVPLRASQMLVSDHDSKDRTLYLRALAIRLFYADVTEINFAEIIPEAILNKEKAHEKENDIREYKEIINTLSPLYLLRLKVIANKVEKLSVELAKVGGKPNNDYSRSYRQNTIQHEICRVYITILVYCDRSCAQAETANVYREFIKESKGLSIYDRISAVRAATHLQHLSELGLELEQDAFQIIKKSGGGPEEVADFYIKLARAVVIKSCDDAREYFNSAIEIVSKFGDEIHDRWVAISSLAAKAAKAGPVGDEIGYRFIRIAEVVGDMLRDKDWNRPEAIILSTRLSFGAGLSALSRWRDRDVGYFHEMLDDLLPELVSSGYVPPSVAWALTRLLGSHYVNELLTECFKKEQRVEIKQYLLDDAVRLLQLEGSPLDYWKELLQIAKTYNLQNGELEKICGFYGTQKKPADKSNNVRSEEPAKSADWNKVFSGCDLTSPEGISQAYNNLKRHQKEQRGYWEPGFWTETIKRITEGNVLKVIEAILLVDFVNFYDAISFFEAVPETWKNKISYINRWPSIVTRIGQKFAYELANTYSLKYIVKKLSIEDALLPNLNEGIVDRFANTNEFNNATSFFGFVSIVTNQLNTQEARDALEFSIKRFELHIEDYFGDGKWDTWLQTSEKWSDSIAGLIWSALGSPRAAMRWNAVHSVKVLAELGCVEVMDSLVTWLSSSHVGAYGSSKFPFYNLHARLYLLIAHARISIDNPDFLKKYSAVYAQYATEPHTLIQKFSLDVARNIQSRFPGTYDTVLFAKMANSIKKNKPVKKIKRDTKIDTIWHAKGEIQRLEFHFGWDFDRYWYEPLGEVFGVPGSQIQDLAAQVVVNEWGIGPDRNGFYQDPRSRLWNNSSDERETWHSHGGYPRTDNLDFYHSYHAMFVVSAKLFESMEVVSSREEKEKPWEDWLSHHLISRDNGKWIAELRDPLPLNRPKWRGAERDDSWIEKNIEKDFFDCLVSQKDNETWLSVAGSWHEIDNYNKEAYSITTAIVGPETSESLMNALDTCNDRHDYYLPYYEDSDGEIDEPPFILRGLLKERHLSRRLDENDPYANDIEYPPLVLGDRLRKELDLKLSEDEKLWYSPISKLPSVICEMWNSPTEWNDKESKQSGHRLRASLPFLMSMCKKLKCHLIFEVGIKREHTESFRKDKGEYRHPKTKTFILTSNGELKNAKRSFKLR